MMTRRAFVTSSGLALVAAGVGGVPSFLARAAQAAPAGLGRKKVLVTIFQRGAMDGLAAVQPLADPMLARLRPTLALGARQLVDLDVQYGLHPSLGPLARYFTEGRLGIVHGAGSPVPTRSHFDAQDFMETGQPGDKRADTGWLNRATGLLGHEPTPFQAVALTPALPLSLRGDAPALAVARLEDFGVAGPGMTGRSAAGETLEALYAQTAGDLLSDAGREGLDAARLLDDARLDQYTPENGAVYPRSELGESLRQIAQLVKADVGLEVAFAETGGWDTHARQGGDAGSFARRADDLAQSVAAFWTDLERHHDDVVVLTMTEFGRTVAENGTGGTDHGRASAMFVLGNDVRGGEVHGVPLVLDPDALEDGRDLPVTTDFRSLFAGVAGGHLGVPTGATLFPGWSGQPLDLIRG
ncbi:DUF1501 domain-containing protein [Rubrivirga sp.]|uniref:DUF1501 domain-containing protein n=1 Tax=Rubrivirga sp. TaxID=1885344 RepID=UPI003B52415A